MNSFFKKAGSGVLNGLVHIFTFILRLVMYIIYLPKVEYTDPKAREAMKNGAVLIANHTSHKDGFFVPQLLLHTKTYVLITRKWYDKKFLNSVFRRLPYIPINLNEADAEWMPQAEAALKNGDCVLIFPEGKREENGVREPFHSGFLLPVRHLDVPVIPMAISGDYKIFRRQKLVIGSPLKLDLNKSGRLSSILKSASDICEAEVFALADKAVGTK